MTDVGLRVSIPSLGHHHSGVRVRRYDASPRTRSMLPWDLLLSTAVAAGAAALWPIAAVPVVALLLACWATCLVLARTTEIPVIGSQKGVLVRVVRAGRMFALTGSALTVVPGVTVTTANIFAMALTWVAILCAVRVVFLLRPPRPRCVLVVGDATERRRVVEALEQGNRSTCQVVSVCLESDSRSGLPGEISLPLEDVPEYAGAVGAGAVVVVPSPLLDPLRLRRLQWLLEGSHLPCFVSTGLVGVAPTRLAAVDVGGQPLIRVHAASRSGPAWMLVEWVGRCLAAVALVVAFPFLVLLAVAIRRDSRGPAIYRQARVGQDGRTFTVLKLRTMTTEPMDAAPLENDFDGVLFKMRRDPRITRLGGWLRKYSVDELPQLANVALGQMRLVGPRPALPEEVAEYSEDAHRRLAVKPGITGLWQVSGRSDLTWEETVRLDLHYVDNWSLWLDLIILGRTVSAVLGHRGAY